MKLSVRRLVCATLLERRCGHMVYAHEPDLKALHANVSASIEKTKNGMAGQ